MSFSVTGRTCREKGCMRPVYAATSSGRCARCWRLLKDSEPTTKEFEGQSSGVPRKTFEKLCSLAKANSLHVELYVGKPECFVRVTDGADGSSGAATSSVSRVDEAAAAVILCLAKAGIR